MKIILSQIALILILSITIFSQGVNDKIELFDEFENLPMGDYLARLDALAQNIYVSRGKKIGLIRVHGNSKNKNYAYPFQRKVSYETYLTKIRQYDTKWFRFQNCDLDKKNVTTRFYLIPKDSENPKCSESIIIPQKTVRFSTRYYENPHYYFDNPYPEFYGVFPTIENKILNKLLKKSPDSKIVLIGYLGSNVYKDYQSYKNESNDYSEIRKSDKAKLIKKILKEQKKSLRKSGIPSSKISTVNGGYKDSTRHVEIWFVPKDGKTPIAKPDYFPKQKATLFDEFGSIKLDDLMARIGAAMVETQTTSNSKALFRIYGNSLEIGNNPFVFAELIEGYWVNTHKFSADKLIIQHCFSESKLRTQIWLVSKESIKQESCKGSLKIPSKSTLFGGIYFYLDGTTITPLRKSYVGIGPSEGSYSEDSLKAVKKFLDESAKHKIYLISYAGVIKNIKLEYKNGEQIKNVIRNLDKEIIVKKRIENVKKELIKNGIKPSQFEIINGGYKEHEGALELWFVPKGGEIPTPKPNYFPNKKK